MARIFKVSGYFVDENSDVDKDSFEAEIQI